MTPEQLFAHASDGYLLLDADLRVRYLNPAAHRFLAAPTERILGESFGELVPLDVPGDVSPPEAWAIRLHRAATQRTTEEFVARLRTDERRVMVTAFATAEALLVALKDVTEAQATEHALLEREGQLQRVLAATGAGAFDVDLVNRISYFNPNFGLLFGYAPGEAPTAWEAFAAQLHPDDLAAMRANAADATQSGQMFTTDCRITRVDGTTGWVRIVADITRNETGVALRSSGTVIDISSERAASTALRESERQLTAAQRLSGIGSWSWNVLNGEVTWSAEMYRILGYDPASTAPSFALVLAVAIDEARQAQFLALVERALRGEERYEFEMPMRRMDGAIRLLYTRGEVDRDASGTAVRMTGTAEDVTERRHAMEALRQAEQELYRAQRMARVGSFVRSARTAQLWWSPMTRTILEIGDDETPTLDLALSRFAPEDAAIYRSLVQRALETGEGYEIEAETVMPSGRRLIVRLSGEVDRDPDGTTVSLHGLLADITEQRDQERALRESEERFRTIWEASPIGIRFSNANGNSIYANPRLLEMFDCTLEDFRSDRWRERVHPDDRERVAAYTRAARDGAETLRVEYRVVWRDGSVHHVRATLAILRSPDGRFAGHIGALEDLTEETSAREEKARIERQMHQTQKLESLGVLAGGIAHDFNNLLVGVLTNASVALMDMSPDEPSYDTVREIERAAQRAAELTRQLLAYAGKGRFIIEPLSFSELAVEMTQLLRTVVSKRASLRLDVQHDVPLVRGDATQLRQVLMNLITNASDSLGDGDGEILLRTQLVGAVDSRPGTMLYGGPLGAGPWVVLEVADTGSGMDAETVQRIFDPFFTTKFTGRGLGLAATLGIVRGHDGAILVRSTPGQGTSVALHFPITSDVRRETPLSTAAVVPGAGTILVVDDDDGVRAVARSLLQRQGYTVVVATNGREGVERFIALQDEVRAVLLDLTMPVMGGDEALRQLRAIAPDVRVVLMSGYSDTDVEHTFAGAGLSGFLQKPFRADDVYRALEVALADSVAGT
jgi:PAS domain S-box-containing protein